MIEDVLTKDTVAQINTLIDEHAAFKSNGKLVQEGSALAGSARADGRHTMSGMLGWPEPVAAPFRELLWHPKLVPVLQTVLGDGYRLDNGPLVMQNSPGGGGQRLHGAPLPPLLPPPLHAAAAAAATATARCRRRCCHHHCTLPPPLLLAAAQTTAAATREDILCRRWL